jgi:hypothetical protein
MHSYLKVAELYLADAVATAAKKSDRQLTWVDIKTIETHASSHVANAFQSVEQVVSFIGENPAILKQRQRHLGADGTELWQLVRENIPAFLRETLSDVTADLYAAQFEHGFDPDENVRSLGREVADAWESRAGENKIVQRQLKMLREQLGADDLTPAVGSLRRVLSSGPLSAQFEERLQDACDAFSNREAFQRIGQAGGATYKA